MKIRPVFDRLTVEKIEQADKTKSGLIVIPDDAKSPSQLGRVLAVGQGRNYDGPGAVQFGIPSEMVPGYAGERQTFYGYLTLERPTMIVKPGDLVIYGRYAGAEVEVEGVKVFILREDEVLGIVEESAANTAAPSEPAPEEAPVH